MADAQGDDMLGAQELAAITGRKARAVLMWTTREHDPCPCVTDVVDKKRRKVFQWAHVRPWMKRNGLHVPDAPDASAPASDDAGGADDAGVERGTDRRAKGDERDLLETLQEQLDRILRLSDDKKWDELSPAQHARHIDSVAKLVREITTMTDQLTKAKVMAGELIPVADAQDEIAEICKRFTQGIDTLASDCASTAARVLIEKGFLVDTVDTAQIERVLAARFRESTHRVRRSIASDMEAVAAA